MPRPAPSGRPKAARPIRVLLCVLAGLMSLLAVIDLPAEGRAAHGMPGVTVLEPRPGAEHAASVQGDRAMLDLDEIAGHGRFAEPIAGPLSPTASSARRPVVAHDSGRAHNGRPERPPRV